MGNLLLNSRADRHSRALGDLKKAYPGYIHLLSDTHIVGETVTVHKQATGAKFAIAKCIKRATSHDNTGKMSIRSGQVCTSHASLITRSLPWPDDVTAIRRR